MSVDTKILVREVTAWIKNYAESAGIKTLIVGVSGGLDSAVVLKLCQRTGIRTIGIAMPMGDKDDEFTLKAMELGNDMDARGEKVQIFLIPIEKMYAAYGSEINLPFTDEEIAERGQLCLGNLRSRIRANVLYHFAGMMGGLVVGTGNKDEDTIGYFTKGGDGLVDICPLSDIHKHDVRLMAIETEVTDNIVNAVPSAGLWEGQTDEDELGMTYDEIEWAIRFDDQPDTCPVTPRNCFDITEGRKHEVLSKVRHMRKVNSHKLFYPPTFPLEKLY